VQWPIVERFSAPRLAHAEFRPWQCPPHKSQPDVNLWEFPLPVWTLKRFCI